jgi:hypothetical protein
LLAEEVVRVAVAVEVEVAVELGVAVSLGEPGAPSTAPTLPAQTSTKPPATTRA